MSDELWAVRFTNQVKRTGQSGKVKPMVAANNDALIGHSQEGSWVAKTSDDLWSVMTTRMSEWNTT
jgi:hypothetical protein